MRTIPYSLLKSSTKDLSLPIFELVFSLVCARFDANEQCRSHCMILGSEEPIRTHDNIWEGKKHIAAFQHGFWLRGVQP
jgi:hypothetical protein